MNMNEEKPVNANVNSNINLNVNVDTVNPFGNSSINKNETEKKEGNLKESNPNESYELSHEEKSDFTYVFLKSLEALKFNSDEILNVLIYFIF